MYLVHWHDFNENTSDAYLESDKTIVLNQLNNWGFIDAELTDKITKFEDDSQIIIITEV